MSFEIGAESIARYHRGSRRPVATGYGYPGLGATGVIAISQRVLPALAPVQATAPWQVGLPGPGDSKDQTRIAYAKRDHDLAMPPRNDATAYANLKSQAAGSATKVGKAWYNAALADVNRARIAAAPRPPNPLTPTGPNPGALTLPTVTAAGPYVTPVLRVLPIVQQATDMGLKVQQTSDGSVVAVDSSGAVVSKPLPVPTSAVTDSAIVPANAVQANAPPAPPAKSSGIFSIFDKLLQNATSPASTSSDNFVASQGAPSGIAPSPVAPTIQMADAGGFGAMFSNPIVLVGAGLAVYLLFASSSGRRR